MAISVEPVSACNLSCVECVIGRGELERKPSILSIENYKKIIDQLHSHLIYISLFFQGEPFLHPKIIEMISYAHEHRIFTSISTNGHFFEEEAFVEKLIKSHLDRLIISIDGTTQEVYEQYRKGGNLDLVLEGVRRVVRLKKKLHSASPFIELQFLVSAKNEHQMQDIKKFYQEVGADKLSFKTLQIQDFKNGSDLMPKNQRYSRYKRGKDGKYYLKGKLRNSCWRQWSGAVFTSSLDILPCCFDKNAHFKLGNLQKEDFKQVWKNQASYSFKNNILKHRKEIDMCTNCTEV